MAVTSFDKKQYENIKKSAGTIAAESYKKRYITDIDKYDYIAKYDQAEADKLINKTYDDGKSSGNVPSATTTKGVTPSTTPSTSPSTSPSTGVNTTTQVSSDIMDALNKYSAKYGESVQSQAVTNALNYLNSVQNNRPDAFQSSYEGQLNDIYNKIMNRENFEYDLNTDMLYQQAKDQYTALGKMAMQDTMGQAAAMTGGYGNSYANTAGFQAYQAYLQDLNNNVPEYYQMALDKYNQDTSNLYNQYAITGELYNDEYSKYRDEVNDWYNDYNNAVNRYVDERNLDYNAYTDAQSLAYQRYADAVANEQWQKEYANMLAQQAIANEQWQKEFDANSDATYSNIYNSILDKLGIKEGDLATGKTNNLTDDQIERLDALAANSDYEEIEKWLTKWMQDGTISEDMALYWMEYYYKVPDNPLMAYNDSITKG